MKHPKLETRIQTLTALMHATPTGIDVHRATAVLKTSTDTAGDVLGVMRDRGMARCARVGVGAVWFLLEHADEALGLLAKHRAERHKLRNKSRRRRDEEKIYATGDTPNALQARMIARVMAAMEDGGESREIAERMGLGPHRAKVLMGVAVRFGRVVKVQRGVAVIWMPADRAPKWVEPEPAPVADLPVVDPHPFVHRRADAFSPLPFRCTAPASVFHMGAMA